MQRRKFLLACLAGPGLVSAGGAHAAASTGPTEVVERLQSTLVSVMSNAQKLGYQGRHKRFKPVVEDTHDLAGIAQIAAGRHWTEFNAEQRKRFVEAFSELSVATYADRFDGYSGEAFKILAERKLENGDALVQSVLAEPAGGRTRFDYVLRQKDGRWAIVNIIADGVSDLAIKRSEYAGILKSEGADALIAKIRTKTAEHGKSSETGK